MATTYGQKYELLDESSAHRQLVLVSRDHQPDEVTCIYADTQSTKCDSKVVEKQQYGNTAG